MHAFTKFVFDYNKKKTENTPGFFISVSDSPYKEKVNRPRGLDHLYQKNNFIAIFTVHFIVLYYEHSHLGSEQTNSLKGWENRTKIGIK